MNGIAEQGNSRSEGSVSRSIGTLDLRGRRQSYADYIGDLPCGKRTGWRSYVYRRHHGLSCTWAYAVQGDPLTGEDVWYVIQTYSGNEAEVSNFIRARLEPKVYKKCFVPIYEEVRHKKGKSRILFRKLFPGYVFIDIDETGAEKVHRVLRKFPEFARILSTVSRDGKKIFKAIEPDEQEFLESLLEDGVLRVSYIETEKNKKKIKRIIGPLGKYRNNITSFSTSSREAIVEIDMLGVHHRIRFGLWNEEDAKLPVFEELMGKPEETVLYGTGEIDVGIYPGDIVIGKEEPFEGITFIVEKVNLLQRTIDTKMELFGSLRDMTVYIDQVEKPERQNIDQLVL